MNNDKIYCEVFNIEDCLNLIKKVKNIDFEYIDIFLDALKFIYGGLEDSMITITLKTISRIYPEHFSGIVDNAIYYKKYFKSYYRKNKMNEILKNK